MAVTEEPKTAPVNLLWLAIIVVAIPIITIALLSWLLHWSWLPNLWFNYAWSSDKGNGPEALQQTIVYGAIAVILVPPIRHALERFAQRHVDAIKQHVSDEHDIMHEHIAHFLKHKDNPNPPPFVPTKERPQI